MRISNGTRGKDRVVQGTGVSNGRLDFVEEGTKKTVVRMDAHEQIELGLKLIERAPALALHTYSKRFGVIARMAEVETHEQATE